METSYTIRTYNGKQTEGAVYVLNRGANTGRRLDEPCPNCWVITCSNENRAMIALTVDFIYHSKALRPYLHGTCVEFVLIGHYRKVFRESLIALLATEHPERLTQLSALIQHRDRYVKSSTEVIGRLNVTIRQFATIMLSHHA